MRILFICSEGYWPNKEDDFFGGNGFDVLRVTNEFRAKKKIESKKYEGVFIQDGRIPARKGFEEENLEDYSARLIKHSRKYDIPVIVTAKDSAQKTKLENILDTQKGLVIDEFDPGFSGEERAEYFKRIQEFYQRFEDDK